MCIHNKNIMSS